MKKTVMLKKNYEFKNVFTSGKRLKGTYLEIFVKKNHRSINNLGIAVSKKVGNSVTRNSIKRKIRETYRLLEKDLQTGYSIIILWKKNVLPVNATFFNINEEIKSLLKKEKILNEEI